MIRSLPALAALLALATPALAQPVTRPERGSPERASILDALRTDAEHDEYAPTRRGVIFTDVDLRVAGNYAFANVLPTLPGGRTSDHCDRRLGSDGDGDAQIVALLYRAATSWQVLDMGTCHTDVFWAGTNWPGRFGAPASLDPQFMETARFPASATTFSAGDGFLSLRSEPSVARGSRLQRMPDGTRLAVQRCGALERVDGDWGRWCRVRAGRQDGWAFSHYLSF